MTWKPSKRNNVRNLIVISGLLSLLSFCAASQTTDTLWFSREKTYSRCTIAYGNELLFGTSQTGVIALNPKTQTTRTLLPNLHQEEVRDLWLHRKKLYVLFSGDHAFVHELDLEKQTERLILADSNTFLDDLSSNGKQLLVLGDPKDGFFYIRSYDFKTQTLSKLNTAIPALPDEACYAASGTTALFLKDGTWAFIAGGGTSSRICYVNLDTSPVSYRFETLPLATGAGCGPFTFCLSPDQDLFVLGGCYQKYLDSTGTGCIQTGTSSNWTVSNCPYGYRSCVIPWNKSYLTCGTNGISSFNPGTNTWNNVLPGNFCAMYRHKKILYATSTKGFCLRVKGKSQILKNQRF